MPANTSAAEIVLLSLRNRFQEIANKCIPPPTEIAFLFESSERGNRLVERYTGPLVAHVDGKPIPVHKCVMPKSARDECIEVADFIANAIGGHANHNRLGRPGFRKDFEAVFHGDAAKSFILIDRVEQTPAVEVGNRR